MPLLSYNNLLNFIDNYRCIINESCEYITYLNISNSRRLSLLNIINKFKVFDSVNLSLFLTKIKPYIDEYYKIIKIVIRTNSKGLNIESKSIVDKKQELSIIIKYQVDKFILDNVDLLESLYQQDDTCLSKQLCPECNIENCLDNSNICIYCGYEIDDELQEISVIINKNDTEQTIKKRPNKHKDIYLKLQELQCKINPMIPSKTFDYIKSIIDERNIKDKDITIATIRSILKTSPLYKKYYKYDKFFVKSMTGKSDYDFTKEQEDNIMNDFHIIYDGIIRLNIKMPDYNYIIYNILRKQNIPCNPDHFDLVKTSEKQSYQEELMRTVLKDIGWKYYTFF